MIRNLAENIESFRSSTKIKAIKFKGGPGSAGMMHPIIPAMAIINPTIKSSVSKNILNLNFY